MKPDVHNQVPYSDGVNPDFVKLPEDNNPVIPNGATYFEKLMTDK